MTERLGIPGEIALWGAWLLTSLLIAAGAMISFGCSGWACELLSLSFAKTSSPLG